MLNIYTLANELPYSLETDFSEVFFARNFGFSDLTDTDFDVIREVDNAVLVRKELFETPFGFARFCDLSTGSKTIISVLHFTDRCLNLSECGNNAITVLARICWKKNINAYAFLPVERRLEDDVCLEV